MIPSRWFSQCLSQPVEYTPVMPTVVVELAVDASFEDTAGATPSGSCESATTWT
jgi:hypothetical protein